MTDLRWSEDAETVAVYGGREGAPVDPPDARRTVHATITGLHDQRRRPIVPGWLLNPEQRRQVVAMAVRFGLHTGTYHVTRTPKYLAKAAFWAPVGVVSGAWRILRWAWDLEGFALRQAAVTAGKHDEYMALSRQRDRRVGTRMRVLLPVTVILTVGVFLFVVLGSLLAHVIAIAIALPVLAWIGRPADKPITDRVTVGEVFIKLTAEQVRGALGACGIGIKDPSAIKFPRDIYRDPPGWSAIVNLPPGVLAADVIDKRDRLAAGLRLPKSQVWPSPVDGEHPGQLSIWVADKPVNAMKAPPWPLLNTGRVDYFAAFPFGFDERQRLVTWRFDEKNSLFGGIPGSGKSMAVRVLALAAILDPIVVPVIFEMKGSGDFDPIEPLCPPGLYGSGADEGTKIAAMDGLGWLLRQCDSRGPLVKTWAATLGCENKVNRQMCEREPGLRPIVAIFDEIQELFTDPELGKRAVAVATSIIKRGRALGIHLVLATQRLDSASIPRGISSNVSTRMCLAVTSHIETDLVLGTGSYARGARPTEFEPGPDSGWGWRAGLGRTAPVRAAHVDNADAARVVRRAAAMRTATNMMEMPRIHVRDLRRDITAVWPDGVTGWWLADILTALQALDDTYADMDAEALSAALRATGIQPEPIHRKINGKGVTRHGLQLASMPKPTEIEE